jgi:hypothetical protein
VAVVTDPGSDFGILRGVKLRDIDGLDEPSVVSELNLFSIYKIIKIIKKKLTRKLP